ncbi:peroxidase-like [Ischnura elegans]|uniref:peroxidase-like n=1 Tax=Ischnura elegans TaxID=197161 RepID=UPI001ED8A821|nr:peroxidase-like [Ischnura elegans]
MKMCLGIVVGCLLVLHAQGKPQQHPFLGFTFSPAPSSSSHSFNRASGPQYSSPDSYQLFQTFGSNSAASSPGAVNFESNFFPEGAFGFSSSGPSGPSGPAAASRVIYKPSRPSSHSYNEFIHHPAPAPRPAFVPEADALPKIPPIPAPSFATNYFPSGGFHASGPSGPSGPSSLGSGFLGSGSFGQQRCEQQPVQCNPKSKYRTIDGSCNNLANPRLGTPNNPYGRLVAYRYPDGKSAPADLSVKGGQLPSPRLLSTTFFPDAPVYDPKWTLGNMQWGQIITHDMSFGAMGRQAKIHTTDCCSGDGRCLSKEVQTQHKPDGSCFPIDIPADDPFYSKFNQECMDFVRTATDATNGCGHPFGPARQLSTVTSYMDASLVYGADQTTADGLRLRRGGRLITEVRQGQEWPPTSMNKTGDCESMSDDEVCYRGGDARINQNTELTVLHIVLHREHNRIADHLAQLNPHWDDETLYQEARRILIAEYQHINYWEWIPIMIGWDAAFKNGVLYDNHGDFTNDYDENVDPSVLDAHATAAFRYFHSLIQGYLEEITQFRQAFNAIRLSDYFNRPQIIEQDGLDKFVRGMSTQPQHGSDRFFTAEITQYMFRAGRPFGMDLRSIDIQRGRDHALGTYNDYREVCGLPRATHFEDFLDAIDKDIVDKLAEVYASPEDVEINVGGFLERHVPGTLAGPTFVCILSEQFRRTRAGDRHFYEHGGFHHSFTPDQLKSIRGASFARLLCDNGDDITEMQPRAFEQLSHDNQVVPCDRYDLIPVVDLTPWQEVPSHNYEKKKRRKK